MTRIIVAITGASGAIYGVHLLEALKKAGVQTHLMVSTPAKQIIEMETGRTLQDLFAWADRFYQAEDMTAPPASGSFLHQGMVIAPCSMKTLSAVAHGYADNLITRAADVTIKEKRRLILLPRETPLSPLHLE
ncbi:MAG: UbiX family flavin prenyltransferase, partial [Moorella sp. (in: Bacteria)]|nr:UbiX family flavin prenyltransferase [Moorella sp. (in: firmicutes)]